MSLVSYKNLEENPKKINCNVFKFKLGRSPSTKWKTGCEERPVTTVVVTAVVACITTTMLN
jgi:hypothetical protein